MNTLSILKDGKTIFELVPRPGAVRRDICQGLVCLYGFLTESEGEKAYCVKILDGGCFTCVESESQENWQKN